LISVIPPAGRPYGIPHLRPFAGSCSHRVIGTQPTAECSTTTRARFRSDVSRACCYTRGADDDRLARFRRTDSSPEIRNSPDLRVLRSPLQNVTKSTTRLLELLKFVKTHSWPQFISDR
jgi:hypothetical protein